MTKQDKPDVTIALLTWNRGSMLPACLQAMYAALSPNLKQEILILDNGSTDDTSKVLKEYEARSGTTVIRFKNNKGLSAYKQLFNRAKGRVIIDMDDDVISFPDCFDETIVKYLDCFPEFCSFALNPIQNEHTSGAKAPADKYKMVERDGLVAEEGPVGGWTMGFRRKDYRKIALVFNCLKLNHARAEDGALIGCFLKLLRFKHHGIIHSAKCLHAVGPWYAAKFGTSKREQEKYANAGLKSLAEEYEDTSQTK